MPAYSYFHVIDDDDPADRQRQVDKTCAGAACAASCKVFTYPTHTAVYVTFDSDADAMAHVLRAPKALVCSRS